MDLKRGKKTPKPKAFYTMEKNDYLHILMF